MLHSGLLWLFLNQGYSAPPKFVLYQRSSSFKSCLLTKVIFIWRSSSIGGRLPARVDFDYYQRLSSMKGWLPLEVIFHQRLFFIKSPLTLKVTFNWRGSSTEGFLSLKVHPRLSFMVIFQRVSTIEGHFPLKNVFHCTSSSIEAHFPCRVILHQVESMCKIPDM